MGRIAVVLGVFVLWSGALAASEWQALSGADIGEALSEKTLHYDGATQAFYASGRTLYNAGSDSWGYWRCAATNTVANGRRAGCGIVTMLPCEVRPCGSSGQMGLFLMAPMWIDQRL